MARDNADHTTHPDVMSVVDAANMLGVHRETIRRWIRTRRVPVLNPGGGWLVRKEDVEKCRSSE